MGGDGAEVSRGPWLEEEQQRRLTVAPGTWHRPNCTAVLPRGTAGSRGLLRASRIRTEAKRREWASRPRRATRLWHSGRGGLEWVLPTPCLAGSEGD